ncbi:MAG: aminopeptidase [Candidatus Bipolaricaulota bacterium]|nr:MAG: aminopeptidase [Candidatus Bipolaricaulota bacterium]
MTDPRVDKLAQVLVNYSTAIQPGQKVFIQGGVTAAPLMRSVVAEVLRAGGHPLAMAQVPGMNELLYELASEEQLQYIPEPMTLVMETYDAMISLMSSENTKALTNVPPQKMMLTSRAQREIMATFMRRSAAGEVRWVGTLFPTNAYAQDAEMGLREYEDFVYRACLPDFEDPAGHWERLSAWQQSIVDVLDGKNRLEVRGPDVELSLAIAERRFVNCDGKRNMPDGEVFTGPVEDSVEGHVRFSYPSTYQGRTIEGIHLWFEKGKVVKATADKDEAFLLEMLETDEGARYVGEFAVGTNVGITRATGNTLFDEKIGGSFHMALGAGLPETGSVNESAIHWDMVCDLKDGGEIHADGELIYKDGKFTIGS